MIGTIALQGGGPFGANDALDRRLPDAAGASRVVVPPRIDASEETGKLIAASVTWGDCPGLGGTAGVVRAAFGELPAGSALARGPADRKLVGEPTVHGEPS